MKWNPCYIDDGPLTLTIGEHLTISQPDIDKTYWLNHMRTNGVKTELPRMFRYRHIGYKPPELLSVASEPKVKPPGYYGLHRPYVAKGLF